MRVTVYHTTVAALMHLITFEGENCAKPSMRFVLGDILGDACPSMQREVQLLVLPQLSSTSTNVRRNIPTALGMRVHAWQQGRESVH